MSRFTVAALLLAASWLTPAGAQEAANGGATAVFAGGCFWCTEADFEKVPGVLGAVPGYTGGTDADPTYGEVSVGGTGHAEAVEVRFGPARVSYGELLRVFWHSVDPLDADGQFRDRGDQYRSAVFVEDEAQRRLAEELRPRPAAGLVVGTGQLAPRPARGNADQ